jgi:dTDP-4-amino-4,6-dideoxygalactose transaminase
MDHPTTQISFNCPMLVGRELEYIRQAVEAMHTSGDGPFTRKAAALLVDALSAEAVLLTPSCTAALEMAAILLEVDEGDEVIVPSFAFVSTVNAFVLRGARPVFADIRPDTLNLDEQTLGALIGPRTRAIVPVHYAGVACEMDAIGEAANRHGIGVVEDNAHGLFGTYRGRLLGTLTPLSTLSFHETKNFNCGEGGALVINEARFRDRAEFVRDKGTNRQQLFRGQVDKYTWVDLGSSYVLSDILAAYLYAQLERRQHILASRAAIWQRYDEGLRGWAEGYGIGLPQVPSHCGQAYHMYYLLLPSLGERQDLIAHLASRGIASVFHYTPLHLSPMGRSLGGREGQCPVTERVSQTLVRLPFHLGLTPQDQERVVGGIREFFER